MRKALNLLSLSWGSKLNGQLDDWFVGMCNLDPISVARAISYGKSSRISSISAPTFRVGQFHARLEAGFESR